MVGSRWTCHEEVDDHASSLLDQPILDVSGSMRVRMSVTITIGMQISRVSALIVCTSEVRETWKCWGLV